MLNKAHGIGIKVSEGCDETKSIISSHSFFHLEYLCMNLQSVSTSFVSTGMYSTNVMEPFCQAFDKLCRVEIMLVY